MNKEQFKKKLTHGPAYCMEHDKINKGAYCLMCDIDHTWEDIKSGRSIQKLKA